MLGWFPRTVLDCLALDSARQVASLLSPRETMCYNLAAMELPAKQRPAAAEKEPALALMPALAPVSVGRAERPEGSPWPRAGQDASRYCPVCALPLESRRCKLFCPVCGYYMSCSDYY